MLSEMLTWFVLVQLATFKGCFCINATQKVNEEHQTENMTLSVSLEETTTEIPNSFEPVSLKGPSFNQTLSELTENAFEDYNTTKPVEQLNVNNTITAICMNVSSVNLTCIQELRNDTLITNYIESAESSDSIPAYRLQNTAAIAAGVFLISAVVGYLSCVGYRQFLQRKYGNSQILIGEEVYDRSDLKYFEI